MCAERGEFLLSGRTLEIQERFALLHSIRPDAVERCSRKQDGTPVQNQKFQQGLTPAFRKARYDLLTCRTAAAGP